MTNENYKLTQTRQKLSFLQKAHTERFLLIGSLKMRNLRWKKNYSYLWTTFKFNGTFKTAINKQIVQAKCATFSLVAKARRLNLHIDIQLYLFDTCIAPILLYVCKVWGFSDLSEIELFHNQFCKYLLRIGKKICK